MRPYSGNRRLEIIDTGDVLDDVVAGLVPDIDAKSELGLGLHGAAPPRGRASWPPVRCYAGCVAEGT